MKPCIKYFIAFQILLLLISNLNIFAFEQRNEQDREDRGEMGKLELCSPLEHFPLKWTLHFLSGIQWNICLNPETQDSKLNVSFQDENHFRNHNMLHIRPQRWRSTWRIWFNPKKINSQNQNSINTQTSHKSHLTQTTQTTQTIQKSNISHKFNRSNTFNAFHIPNAQRNYNHLVEYRNYSTYFKDSLRFMTPITKIPTTLSQIESLQQTQQQQLIGKQTSSLSPQLNIISSYPESSSISSISSRLNRSFSTMSVGHCSHKNRHSEDLAGVFLLPFHFTPTRYQLRLEPQMDKHTFGGVVNIDLKLEEASNE